MNGRFAGLFVGSLLTTAALFGSNVTVALGSNPFPTGTIGPYEASINGSSLLSAIICDDDTGDVVYANETWTATETSLAAIIAADGNNPATPSSGLRFSPAATSLYEEVGWLVLQFYSHSSDAAAIQTAIWDVFNPGGTTQSGDSLTWLTDAQMSSNYDGSLVKSNVSSILFLTPVSGSQNPYKDGRPQEFVLMTPTPEPETYAMVGAGVILLALGTFRRGGKKQNTPRG